MNGAVETTRDLAVPMGKVMNTCKFLMGSLKEIDRLDELDVDGRIILCFNIMIL